VRARFFPLLVSALAAVLATGCGDPEPLAVDFAGCEATLVPGPVCVLSKDRKLTLWVPSPPGTRIEIRAGRHVLSPASLPVREGSHFELTIPPDADRVEVRTDAPDSAWSLALSAPRTLKPGERDLQGKINEGTRDAYDLIQNFQLTEARAKLDDLDSLSIFGESPHQGPAKLRSTSTPLPAESRYLLAYYRCLLAAKEGDYRTALAHIASALEIADRVKRGTDRWFAEEEHALLLSDLGRWREAAEEFARLASAPRSKKARDQGELLNNQAWATLLAREAASDPENANLENPVPVLDKAIEKFLSDERSPPRSVFSAQLNLVLAHLQAKRPDLAAEALDVARGLEAKAPLLDRLWGLDLAARVDLVRGKARQALATYQRLDQIATAAGSPDGRLRAALGRAHATAALGKRGEAIAILRQAEDLLDNQSLQVPLNDGRATFVSQREGISSLEIKLQLDTGQTQDALDTARRSRSRFLRQLVSGERLTSLSPESRDRWSEAIARYQKEKSSLDEAVSKDWSLPADELGPALAARAVQAGKLKRLLDDALETLGSPPAGGPIEPPRAGELLLAFHPLPGGWVAFAADVNSIAVHPFALDAGLLADPQALAREVLEPFHDEIERAQRIRILPYGSLRSLDFHALPFTGDVLLKAKPVIYGLDVPTKLEASNHGRPGEPRALLVADPNDNLPGALAEVEEVGRAIAAWKPSWPVARLTAAAARADVVRGQLDTLDLFHFSGHGVFEGFGGWDSRLRLADETSVTIGDLLALERAPRWVVLSGCDTGRSGAEARIEGLGIANAFLLAGSRAVVASVRPVDDKTTLRLFAELYRRWDGNGDLAVALQGAQLAWRHGDRNVDWSSFRIVEP
jgi:cellulose synthase operon protein C